METQEEMLAVDHSGRSDFILCPRKWQNRWQRAIITEWGSNPLRYGVGWHGCMEGFYGHLAEHGWEDYDMAIAKGIEKGISEYRRDMGKQEFYDDYRTELNMTDCFMRYCDHYAADYEMLKIIEPERTFMLKVVPNEFEAEAFPGVKPFIYKGRLDLLVELNGMINIMEFKTTGQSIALQQQRLHRSPQVIGYLYGATHCMPHKPEGALVSIHQILARKLKSGGYGKLTVNFSRSPFIISKEDLAHFRFHLIRDVYHLQQAMGSGFYSLNHYSCYTYGGCSYIGLCEQNRPVGEEILDVGYMVDPDPWDVLNEGYEKDNIIESVDDGSEYLGIQRRLYNV
jgi:hypothetical protein